MYGTDHQLARQAAQSCWRKLDRLNMIFSDYDEHSEVSRLSATSGKGTWVRISSELWKVLRLAHQISSDSRGAFDVTIGPLSKLWRRAIRRQEYPEQKHIDTAHAKIGYQYIRYDTSQRAVQLLLEGMHIDLGGIAKGYAIDRLYKHLVEQGFPMAVVNGGGDIYIGLENQSDPWQIRIQGKTDEQSFERTAIACSGATYQYLSHKNQSYSHIVHPDTGLGITSDQEVCIGASSVVVADALASACSVDKQLVTPLLGKYGAWLMTSDVTSILED